MKTFVAVLWASLILCLLSCETPETKNQETTTPVQKSHSTYQSPENAITVMTFNVENLFDTKDDPLKTDLTFLPLELKQTKAHKKECGKIKRLVWRKQCLDWDWSPSTLKIKLDRIATVVKQVRDGSGPDILVLQEVENKAVLESLRKNYLKGLGYKPSILIEGKDLRGIDVAILSKLPVVGSPQLHHVPFKKISRRQHKDTRGILQASFELPDKEILTVFAVHFPAPFHPTHLRKQSLEYLNKLVKQLPKNRLAIAAGDFNIPRSEDEDLQLLNNTTKTHWMAAHKVGCKGCPGTNYYPPKDSWSFLDMILFTKNFSADSSSQSSWKIPAESVRLYNKVSEQVTADGTPKAFKMPQASGVSDHWPLAVDLVPRESQTENSSKSL